MAYLVSRKCAPTVFVDGKKIGGVTDIKVVYGIDSAVKVELTVMPIGITDKEIHLESFPVDPMK